MVQQRKSKLETRDQEVAEKVFAALAVMTAADRLNAAVDAGLLTAQGELTAPYRDDPTPESSAEIPRR